MGRASAVLATTILLLASAARAEEPANPSATEWLSPGLPHVSVHHDEDARFWGSAEALYWEVGDDADYAIRNPSAAVIGAGDVEKVELGWEPGVRIGAGMDLPSGWQFAGRGTWLSADDSDSTSDTANGLINATQIHPFFASQVGDNDISRATGELDLHFYSIELEVGHRFEPREDLDLRLFGGPHIAHIERDASFTYTGFIDPLDVTAVDQDLTMTGYGLRLGADGAWQGPAGISIFAGVAGSLLYGDFEWDDTEVEPRTGTVNVDVSEDYDEMVPVVQMRAGIGWETHLNRRVGLRVHAGWEGQVYFGIDGRRFTDDVFRATTVSESNDISFQGLSAGVAVTF
ncbi:MAG: Lpg1974 family pore-forming outer membrane protein [Myxococcota bacterium]